MQPQEAQIRKVKRARLPVRPDARTVSIKINICERVVSCARDESTRARKDITSRIKKHVELSLKYIG